MNHVALVCVLFLSLSAQLGGCATDAHRTATRRAVIEARVEASNAQDWSRWESLHAPTACRAAPELPGPLCGASAMRAAIEHLVITFPDYHLDVVDVIDDGDRLVVRFHTKGSMKGPLVLGEAHIPANGRTIEQDWVAIVEFDDDNRITRFSEFYDQYILLLQLGLVPGLGT